MSNHYHKLGTDYSHNVLMLTLLESHSEKDDSVHVSGTWGWRSVLSSEDGFSRFVKFQLGDFTVRWVNWDLNLGAVLLISDNLLNVDAPSPSVDGENLTGLSFNSTLLTAAFDENGVSLSDWNRSAVVFAPEFLAQVAGHHLSLNAAWSGEVSLSGLSSLTGNTYTRWLIAKWITY